MTKTELAKQCRVTPATVVAWVAKGCPHTRNARGQYYFELGKVRKWRAQAMPTCALLSPSYSEARARKEAALAGLRELQLREKTGELVLRAAVANMEFSTGREIRDGLQNIGARLGGPVAGEHDPVTCARMIDREILLCLEALTREPHPVDA